MDVLSLPEFSIPENMNELLFEVSQPSERKCFLDTLIEISRSGYGRSELASRRILPAVLELSESFSLEINDESLSDCSWPQLLLLSLKLLRNLCAGEITNQRLFVELNGVGIILNILRRVVSSDLDIGLIRMALQVLANVSLAGRGQQQAIWNEFFPDEFLALARVRRKDTCDPLCLIVYACYDGNPELLSEFSSDRGLPILAEIVRTASADGFCENWIKLLLSRICLEESYFHQLFSELHSLIVSENVEGTGLREGEFSIEQAILLQIMSEIINERIGEITIPFDFAFCILGIFRCSLGVLEGVSRGKTGIPTGFPELDVLGYSLNILRDICAHDSRIGSREDSENIVDLLLSHGLLVLLLSLLSDLEPPSIIRKAMKQGDRQQETNTLKPCPYKGFRRDIVAIIANCIYKRKHAQDEIRQRNGIMLLLQQCVTDEDNPYLREWGIWCMRNLLEMNEENHRVVEELEIQESVDVPEITSLGLKVEVDPRTRHPRLVNVSNNPQDRTKNNEENQKMVEELKFK